MRVVRKLRFVLGAIGIAVAGAGAHAGDTIRIGLLAPFSGPFAQDGKQFEGGVKAWLKQHGDTVAGKKIEIITRDTTGPAPEIGKRLAQELVVRDKVDFLAVGGFTPETLTVGAVANAARTPLIVMNAAAKGLTEKIPYAVRLSYTFPQLTRPLGTWAARNGVRRVVTLVSDYSPGIDAEDGFKEAFTAGGGEIVETLRVPLKNPEFAPFVQRIKDARPDALFAWVPHGEQGVALLKSYYERGLDKAGIRLITLSDNLDEAAFASLGEKLLGTVSSLHYTITRDSPENKAFVKAFNDANGGAVQPTFMAVAAYDGMAAIYEAAKKLKGDIDGPKALEAMAGLELDSPRGRITVDAQTRDVTQAVYIQRVEKIGGRPANVAFEPFPAVKP